MGTTPGRQRKMKKIGILGTILLLTSLWSTNALADQTGNCTAGEQYCEQNSLETTNTTTTTNTNTNNNTNANTNTNTNTNTSTATNTNTNTSTATKTTTNTSTNTNANTNVNTSTATNTNANTNVNTSTATNTNANTNTNTSTSTNVNTNNNVNTSNSTRNSTVNSTVNSNTNSTVNSNNTNVNTNNNTNVNQSTSNSTSNNTNNNNNTNVNQSTSDSKVETNNTNRNENTSTSDNTNRNINESKSEQTINQNIKTEAPPASAIAPSIMSYSQDLCTVGRSGAFQGQVFGLSAGRTVRDENCERLKLGKYLYDMGMKVAAVAIMCQDERVFTAMEMAGTPCPYEGKVGAEAAKMWLVNVEDRPDKKVYKKKLKRRAKEEKAEKKAREKQEREDKKIREAAAIAAAEQPYKDFLAACTLEPNPTRDRIKKDVAGAIDSVITPKTKTRKQCAKEWASDA